MILIIINLKATIDLKTPKAKSILGLNILGRPGLLHLHMRVYSYQARNLPGIYDRDGLSDTYSQYTQPHATKQFQHSQH